MKRMTVTRNTFISIVSSFTLQSWQLYLIKIVLAIGIVSVHVPTTNTFPAPFLELDKSVSFIQAPAANNMLNDAMEKVKERTTMKSSKESVTTKPSKKSKTSNTKPHKKDKTTTSSPFPTTTLHTKKKVTTTKSKNSTKTKRPKNKAPSTNQEQKVTVMVHEITTEAFVADTEASKTAQENADDQEERQVQPPPMLTMGRSFGDDMLESEMGSIPTEKEPNHDDNPLPSQTDETGQLITENVPTENLEGGTSNLGDGDLVPTTKKPKKKVNYAEMVKQAMQEEEERAKQGMGPDDPELGNFNFDQSPKDTKKNSKTSSSETDQSELIMKQIEMGDIKSFMDIPSFEEKRMTTAVSEATKREEEDKTDLDTTTQAMLISD